MNQVTAHRLLRIAVGCAALTISGCSRAPSYDLLGTVIPAWLMCVFAGTLLTVLFRTLLVRARVVLSTPALAYPSLAVVLTLAIWLVFFP